MEFFSQRGGMQGDQIKRLIITSMDNGIQGIRRITRWRDKDVKTKTLKDRDLLEDECR